MLIGPLKAQKRAHTQHKEGRKGVPRRVGDLRQVDGGVWMWEQSERSHRAPEVYPRALSSRSVC